MTCSLNKKFKDILEITKIISPKIIQKNIYNRKQVIPILPSEISLKITTRCNFRCKHCYLWNKSGYYRNILNDQSLGDIDLDIIEKVLTDTSESKPSIRISGGEPLFHPKWSQISQILYKYDRKLSIFTNGFYINNYIEDLVKVSNKMNLVISLDGMEKEHNIIRGSNTFTRVLRNIQLISQLKKRGLFKGGIIVNTFLSNELVTELPAFLKFIASLNIDKHFINFPWYIGAEDAKKMDEFFENNFSRIYGKILPDLPSWHTFTYKLSPEKFILARQVLAEQKELIIGNKIRINPSTEFIKAVNINGTHYSGPSNVFPFCTAIKRSMIIQSNGKVSTCTAFPEFEVGNVRENGVKKIWNCENYNTLRQILYYKILPGNTCLKCPYLSNNFYNL